MIPVKPLKILHLTTHISTGGITSYISIVGSRMVKGGHRISVLSAGGDREDELKRKGVESFRFNIRAKSELHPKLYWALPKIIRLVKKEKFDLLHAHTRVTQVLATLVSKCTKVPVVTTAHGYYKPRFGRKLFGCWGERVIAISPLVAEELQESHKVPVSKIRIIPNAIDFEEFRERLVQKDPAVVKKELGIPADAKVIGSISRLVRDKGQEYLIEAMKKLRKKNSNIFLIIVGDGRERGRIMDLLRRAHLNDASLLIRSEADLTRIFSILDVFVHPATFREGFGLTILEAMAAMVPVVATNIWAINSIIRNQVNGFLVEPKRADGLAAAIQGVLDNPPQAEAVARNAYDESSKLYSVDRLVRELETVYREVLQ